MTRSDLTNFYRDALLNAPYSAGILYLARNIQRDFGLNDFGRFYLMSLACDLYKDFCGRDLYEDL